MSHFFKLIFTLLALGCTLYCFGALVSLTIGNLKPDAKRWHAYQQTGPQRP